MSRTTNLSLDFEAVPTSGVIICHRTYADGRRAEPIKYTQHGMHPQVDQLSPVSQERWRLAVEAMGW